MPYSEKEQKRLRQLLLSVESKKEHENAAPDYTDSPALAEIRAIVEKKLTCEADKEILEDSVSVLRYLAHSYEAMNKVAYATSIYKKMLLTEVKAITEYSAGKDDLKDDFYSAVRARNYYRKDECIDLFEIVLPVSETETATKIISDITKSYPHIKRDATELTDKYLSVIDEVERKIAETKKTDLCHEYWSLKKLYLAKYGVEWRSPSELNPNMIFD